MRDLFPILSLLYMYTSLHSTIINWTGSWSTTKCQTKLLSLRSEYKAQIAHFYCAWFWCLLSWAKQKIDCIFTAHIIHSRTLQYCLQNEHISNNIKNRYHTDSNIWIRWLQKSVTTIFPSLKTAKETGLLNCPGPVPSVPNLDTKFPSKSNTWILWFLESQTIRFLALFTPKQWGWLKLPSPSPFFPNLYR